MNQFISAPSGIKMLGNLEDIILSSNSRLSLSVTHNGVEVIAENSYYPDSSGHITIATSKIISELLGCQLPCSEAVTSTAIDTFTFTLDDNTTTFSCLHGGVDLAVFSTTEFLKKNFLSWQPQERRVSLHTPLWLRYCALENATLQVKAYFPDKSSATKSITEMTNNRIYTANISLGKMVELFGEQPIAYDLWVEASGVTRSYTQRVIITSEGAYDDSFIFQNSLGGFDTVLFSGTRKEIHDVESLLAINQETTSEYGALYKRLFEKSTGYISDGNYRQWVQEFFLSPKRYWLHQGNIVPIYISKNKIENESFELSGYDFTFAASRQTKYRNLSRSATLDQSIALEDDG